MYMRIETKIRWRIVLKILLLFLLAGGIGYFLIASFKFCDFWERFFSILISVAIYAYLFAKVRLIPLLRDKAWLGTVDSRVCKKRTVIRGIVASRSNMQDVMVAFWKIKKDDGEEVTLPYETEVIADNYFRSGDRVWHFKGAKLIVKANPAEDDDNLLCPLCGKMVLTPKCSFCRIRFDIPSQS